MTLVLPPIGQPSINGVIRLVSGINVTATASSFWISSSKPEFAIDKGTERFGWYCSDDKIGSYLEVSFNSHWIFATNYSLQSGLKGRGIGTSSFPKSWKVEGFDGSKWVKISEVSESGLNDYDLIGTWRFTEAGPFNKFKFTNTGPNYGRGYHFLIGRVDFFGFICLPGVKIKAFKTIPSYFHPLFSHMLICSLLPESFKN